MKLTLNGNYCSITEGETKIKKKINELRPFLHFLLEKNGLIVLFCSSSKKFFVMDKEAFEKIGKKYLAKNQSPEFIASANHFKCLYVPLTSKCNLACSYCLGKGGKRAGKTASWKTIKSAIDYIANQKKPVKAEFTSPGEHSLEKELLEKTLDYLNKKLEIREISMSSNGIIKPKTALWLADRIQILQISCDGPPEIQDLQRPMKNGGKSSAKIEETIRELVKHNKNFRLRVTVTKNHVGREEQTFKYFYSLEAPMISLSQVVDLGLGKEYIENSNITDRKLQETVLKIKEYCDEFGVCSRINLENYFGNRKITFCQLGQTFTLGLDGNIAACGLYSDEKDLEIHKGMKNLIFGKFDYKKNRVEVNEKKLGEFRKLHKKANCYKCDLKICWGGCPLKNLGKKGSGQMEKYDCDKKKMQIRTLMKYLMHKNIIRIKPALLEKNNKLFYSMQLSEIELKPANPVLRLKGSSFVKLNLKNDNLEKLSEKMILETKKSNRIILFVLSPENNKLGSRETVLFKEFLYSLKKNKVLFKISKPIKITDFNEKKEKDFYKEFGIPQNCFECLELFTVKNGKIIYCNGFKGQKLSEVFDRHEIYLKFQKDYGNCAFVKDKE